MDLKLKADMIRKDVIRVAMKNGAGHIAPSLSSIDILVALYYKVMNRSADPCWEERDRLVFSKAHGCYGLYAILADIGFVGTEDWELFYNGSTLSGCIERNISRGIEASCGSLGHGLPMAAGLAFGAKLQSKKWHTFCIAGDGEMQEGSVWEALQFAVMHKLDNLIVVIDCNGLQAMDFLKNVLSPEDVQSDLKRKCDAFGCRTLLCDGHDTGSLAGVLDDAVHTPDSRPKVVIAKTIKGYGLYCMENIPKFHFRLPTADELSMGGRFEQ